VRTREIRSTGVRVSELGFGGVGIGELFEPVTDAAAQETLAALWDGGVRFFDTAPLYGHGLSELRCGQQLRRRERSEFTLSTKVGYLIKAPEDPSTWTGGAWAGGLPFALDHDFSDRGVLRSFEDSLQRLGLNRIDILIIHDLDSSVYDAAGIATQFALLEASGWRALEELRASGRIGAIGLGVKFVEEMPRFLDAFDLDFVIDVGHYTLLDQTAHPELLERCARQGVDVVLAGAFNSGILAQRPVAGARFHYRPAPAELIERVTRLDDLCQRHGVPLPAVAIQFPLAHPVVKSVLVGPISADEVRANVRAYEHEIPAALWDDLRAERWIPEDAPVPSRASN
jgi:D-threo-aldose 1-dehydrogenase